MKHKQKFKVTSHALKQAETLVAEETNLKLTVSSDAESITTPAEVTNHLS
jgi:hypothetical protein